MNQRKFTHLKSLMLLCLAMVPGIYANAQYCTSGFHAFPFCTGDEIDGFSTTGGTTTITNLFTGCNGNYDNYIYYSGQMHTATHGDVVSFSIKNNPNFSESFKIWVDWNADDDFDDPGEQMYSSTIGRSGTGTGTFTVPGSAAVGLTRLRVRSGFGGLGTACAATDFGEVEDYDFFVTPSVANSSIPGKLVSPTNFCEGTYPVQVKIQNTGTNVINSVEIAWLLDGVAQPTIVYNTPIPVVTTPGSNQATVTLGNVSFMAPNFRHTIEVTVLNPNGVTNAAATGSNIRTYTLGAGLNGSYTVGGTTPHFTDVVDAVSYLNNFGVCGPVTMNIRPGTYNGRARLNNVNGSSTVNRIAFKSETENPNDVTIQANTNFTTGTDYVFSLNSASNVTLKHLSIKSTTTNGAGNVLDLMNDISNDSVFDCRLYIPSTASWSAYNINTFTGIYGSDNVFMNNTLSGGDFSMSMYGYQENMMIVNNIMLDAFSQTMSLSDIYGLKLTDNKIATVSTVGANMNNYHSAMSVNNCGDDIEISRNRIKVGNGGTGIESWGLYGNSFDPIEIINNEIIIDGTSQFGMAYGISVSGSYLNIYNNSINIPATFTDAVGGQFTWSNDLNIYNNVFSCPGGGRSLFLTAPSDPSIMVDYNNLYTTGDKLVNTDAGNFDSLSMWRTTGNDRNSISYNPGFTNANDLQPDPANPASWSLNGRGVHINGNTTDKNGMLRVENREDGVPDIGAYEFIPTSIPPAAKAQPAQPAEGITQVFTFGGDTVASISWKNTVPSPQPVTVRQYTGTVPPQFPVGNHMYFYTDVNVLNATYDLDAKVYYKDPWMGKIPSEADLRVAKREKSTTPWIAYNDVTNTTNSNLNTISGNAFTSLGYFTGIENDSLFSAYIKPSGSTIFCTGGSVTLVANTNVNAGYTYQWKLSGADIPGATNSTYVAVNAGDYSVVIRDNKSNVTQSMEVAITIVASPSTHVTLNGPRRICPGSTVMMQVATASSHKYQWVLNGVDIPGATNPTYAAATSGTYEVKVKNLGCANISTPVPIVVAPVFAALGMDTAFCQASTLILDAQNDGARYLWNTGDTTQAIAINGVQGKYWVTVDAGPNCMASDTINVTIDPMPIVLGISSVRVSDNTYQFEPGGMQYADSYLWIFGDGTSDTARVQMHEYKGGLFSVKLVVYNGCGSDTTVLEMPLSVQDVTNNSSFELYPNPAKNIITLKVYGEAQFNDVVVVNSIGQIVMRQSGANTKERTFDIQALADGHYFIRANTSDGKIIAKPFHILR